MCLTLDQAVWVPALVEIIVSRVLAKQFPLSLIVSFFLQNGYQELTGVDHPVISQFLHSSTTHSMPETQNKHAKDKAKTGENNGK